MKQLLADFEQLERDVEAETGKDLTIEAICESVGNFSTSYQCDIALPSSVDMILNKNYVDSVKKYMVSNILLSQCEILIGGRYNFKNALNRTMYARESNSMSAEEILY